jgi:uncharacterized membrane protein YjjP (DUF1212 family)
VDEHQLPFAPVLWGGGWLVAVLALFWAALLLPLQTRLMRWRNILYNAGVIVAAVAVFTLANRKTACPLSA